MGALTSPTDRGEDGTGDHRPDDGSGNGLRHRVVAQDDPGPGNHSDDRSGSPLAPDQLRHDGDTLSGDTLSEIRTASKDPDQTSDAAITPTSTRKTSAPTSRR